MKIFGWMHQKLCLGTADYHRVARRNSPDVIFADEGSGMNGTLSATHEKEIDTEALLHHHVLLTIGTFGHCSSVAVSTPPQSERQPSAVDQEDELKQEEVLNSAVAVPTAVMFPSPALEISMLPESAVIEREPDQKKEAVMGLHEEEMVISRVPLLKEDNEKVEIMRTTLADLFAADQEKVRTTDEKPAPADKKQATNCPTKNVLKKIKNAELPPASKKIHRLITRMLKKKIHPDVARGDQERHARRGAAVGAAEGRGGDFRLPRGSG